MTIQEASCFRLHFLTQGGSSTNVLKTTGGQKSKKQLPVWGDDLQKKSKGLAKDSFLEYNKTCGKRRWDIFCYELHPAIVSQSLTNQSCQAYMTYDKEKHANPCPSIASHILKSGNPMPHDPHLYENPLDEILGQKFVPLGTNIPYPTYGKTKKSHLSKPP